MLFAVMLELRELVEEQHPLMRQSSLMSPEAAERCPESIG